jgi:hypothetical protein
MYPPPCRCSSVGEPSAPGDTTSADTPPTCTGRTRVPSGTGNWALRASYAAFRGEQALPGADHDRVQQQVQLVDQPSDSNHRTVVPLPLVMMSPPVPALRSRMADAGLPGSSTDLRHVTSDSLVARTSRSPSRPPPLSATASSS